MRARTQTRTSKLTSGKMVGDFFVEAGLKASASTHARTHTDIRMNTHVDANADAHVYANANIRVRND